MGTTATVTMAPTRTRTQPIECKSDPAALKGALTDLSSAVYAVWQEVAALRWAMGFLAVRVGDGTSRTTASAAAAAAMATSSAASAEGAWRVAEMAAAASPPAVMAMPCTSADGWPSTWGWTPAALPPHAAASQLLPSWDWMWTRHALSDATVAAATGVAGGVPSAAAAAAPQEATEAETGRPSGTTPGHEPLATGIPPAVWMSMGTRWGPADALATGMPLETYAVPPGDVTLPPVSYTRPLCAHTMPVVEVPLCTNTTVPVGGLR
ncbi:hypothetical protein MMPV_007515 [Pyropia vietnamensis]